MRRLDELGGVSDEAGRLTRTFNSPAMARANGLVGAWMSAAGLEVRVDAAFNLLGRWNCPEKSARTLLLGSHLDTVRDAGKYDGPLGVLAALSAVELLRSRHITLPFHVEIAGFSDEEGVRYQTTYLGSRALAGTLTADDLERVEEKGIEKARRRAGEFFAYAEVHIEQGPVLEARNVPVGVVTAIAGQSRIKATLEGRAGHAGTTPMNLRRDALAGAAELVLAAEACGILATVGQIAVEPGASNVIPGRAALTLDIRDQTDAIRVKAVRELKAKAKAIAARRKLRLTWTLVQETASVPCDPKLTDLFSEAIVSQGLDTIALPSGAGHDGAALSRICPVAMLFVRCKGGVSHHPAESIRAADAGVAVEVLADFVQRLAKYHA